MWHFYKFLRKLLYLNVWNGRFYMILQILKNSRRVWRMIQRKTSPQIPLYPLNKKTVQEQKKIKTDSEQQISQFSENNSLQQTVKKTELPGVGRLLLIDLWRIRNWVISHVCCVDLRSRRRRVYTDIIVPKSHAAREW